MRISHKYKFVFFANPKAASSTVRSLLEPHSDLVVPNFPELAPGIPFRDHMRPAVAKEFFEQFGWDFRSYARFTCVRNPWMRQVSVYEHAVRSGSQPPFSQWLQDTEGSEGDPLWLKHGRYPLDAFVQDEDGNVLVDKILETEKLDEQLISYVRSLGVPIPANTKVPTRNHFGVGRRYQEYYDEASRKLVEERFHYEIRHFGYRFEQPRGTWCSANSRLPVALDLPAEPLAAQRILVFSSHRTGSSFLAQQLTRALGQQWIPNHQQPPTFVDGKWDRVVAHRFPNARLDLARVVGETFEHTKTKVKLVAVFRPPEDRLIASMFQHLDHMGRFDGETAPSFADLKEALMDEVLTPEYVHFPEAMDLLCRQLGVDPTQLTFDVASPFSSLEGPTYELHFTTYEKLLDNPSGFVASITGATTGDPKVAAPNPGSQAELEHEFRSHYQLESTIVDWLDRVHKPWLDLFAD